MSAHVSLNLLNELRKNASLAEHLSLFRNEFDIFNNTGARILDSIHHMTIKLRLKRIFGVKLQYFFVFYATLKWA